MSYVIKVTEVEKKPGRFQVTIAGGERHQEVYRYTIKAGKGYIASLGWELSESAELVRMSFAFLLDREPPSAILKEFDLRTIAKYFPQYEEVIRRK